MPDRYAVLALTTRALRTVLLVGGVAVSVAAAVDWAVRTRRLNPFGVVARFMRARVEPRLEGIERQVIRIGGQASSTPWWALVVYVICAALLLAGIDVIASLVQSAVDAATLGPLGVFRLAVHWTFAFFRVALLVRVIASWLPQLASRHWVSWSFGATDWMLRPLRGMIPTIGVMDITPIVAYFALQIAEWLVDSILLAGLR